jgi:Gpi18-like mannosyltransferase
VEIFDADFILFESKMVIVSIKIYLKLEKDYFQRRLCCFVQILLELEFEARKS